MSRKVDPAQVAEKIHRFFESRSDIDGAITIFFYDDSFSVVLSGEFKKTHAVFALEHIKYMILQTQGVIIERPGPQEGYL